MRKVFLCLIFSCGVFCAQGQVFDNGVDVKDVKGDYVKVSMMVFSKITLGKGDVKTYFNGTWGMDSLDKMPLKKMSVKAGEAYLLQNTIKHQLKDSLQVEIKDELTLFNKLSECGFDYLTKEPLPLATLSNYVIGITNYTFRRSKR